MRDPVVSPALDAWQDGITPAAARVALVLLANMQISLIVRRVTLPSCLCLGLVSALLHCNIPRRFAG
jgi:hypothetical protein